MNDSTGADAADLPAPPAPPAPAANGLWAWVCRTLGALIGVWTAPPWLRWVGRQVQRAATGLSAVVRARPRVSAGVALALVALGVGGWFGYQWWKAQPKPVEVSFKVSDPSLTDFANNGVPQPVSVEFSKSVAPLELVGK